MRNSIYYAGHSDAVYLGYFGCLNSPDPNPHWGGLWFFSTLKGVLENKLRRSLRLADLWEHIREKREKLLASSWFRVWFWCQKLITMWIIVSASDFDIDCCRTLHVISVCFWGPTVWGNFLIYATRLICWREAVCCHRRLPTWLMVLIEIHFLSIRRWHSLSHTPPFCSPFIYRETQAAAAVNTASATTAAQQTEQTQSLGNQVRREEKRHISVIYNPANRSEMEKAFRATRTRKESLG